ncbi:MAG: c-type cytochrome domain-containing protein [Pseudomonadota bacterium]
MLQQKLNFLIYPWSARRYFFVVGLLTACISIFLLLNKPVLLHKMTAAAGLSDPVTARTDSFYLRRVQPILSKYCTQCHDIKKYKGHLRLDNFLHSRYSGSHSNNVVANSPEESGLLIRMALPKSDRRAMPPLGLPAPTKSEIEVIRLWILRNASGILTEADFPDAPKPAKVLKTVPPIDNQLVFALRKPLSEAVLSVNAKYPHLVLYDTRSSASLRVTNVSLPAVLSDEVFQTLEKITSEIVSIYLVDAPLTDKSLKIMSNMPKLKDIYITGSKFNESRLVALVQDCRDLKRLSLDTHLLTDKVYDAAQEREIKLYGVGSGF